MKSLLSPPFPSWYLQLNDLEQLCDKTNSNWKSIFNFFIFFFFFVNFVPSAIKTLTAKTQWPHKICSPLCGNTNLINLHYFNENKSKNNWEKKDSFCYQYSPFLSMCSTHLPLKSRLFRCCHNRCSKILNSCVTVVYHRLKGIEGIYNMYIKLTENNKIREKIKNHMSWKWKCKTNDVVMSHCQQQQENVFTIVIPK